MLNLYAVSPKQSKWQERTLLPLILNTYNCHSPSQRDCGEAGREFFHRLCRVSPKYQREHAERVFSNALHTQRGEAHLDTAFHLAEATGVAISYVETVGTVRTAPSNSHTGTRV